MLISFSGSDMCLCVLVRLCMWVCSAVRAFVIWYVFHFPFCQARDVPRLALICFSRSLAISYILFLWPSRAHCLGLKGTGRDKLFLDITHTHLIEKKNMKKERRKNARGMPEEKMKNRQRHHDLKLPVKWFGLSSVFSLGWGSTVRSFVPWSTSVLNSTSFGLFFSFFFWIAAGHCRSLAVAFRSVYSYSRRSRIAKVMADFTRFRFGILLISARFFTSRFFLE